MDFIQIFICTIAAYLIGAIPASVWISQLHFGIDIRDHGSGTASHSNVHRVLGKKWGYLVRVLDILKGLLAAHLAIFVHNQYGIFSDIELPILMMTFGLAAVIGHIFPIFAGFKGGKGYHITLGIILAISPIASLFSVLITALIFILFRYPHLGYVAGGFAIPIFIMASPAIFDHSSYIPAQVFGLCIALVLLLTHRNNIRQIMRGEVNRVSFRWLKR